MTKKINPNLTAEQKLILFEEGTELPGSSELNHEKREGSFHCANCGKPDYSILAVREIEKTEKGNFLLNYHYLILKKIMMKEL